MTAKRAFLAAAATALTAACALTPNGPDEARTVAQAHPITVDQQTVALRVAIDDTRGGLSRADLARIDALVSEYRTRGHGPVTVTAPVGGASDRAAQRTAADVRSALHAFGMPYETMSGASVRTEEGDVIVSFQSYVATGPACGRNGYSASRRLRNVRSENFGCANQSNLAAMIADPRDLHGAAAPDGSGDGKLTEAILTRAATQSPVVTYQVQGPQQSN